MIRRALRTAAAVAAGSVVLAGCSFDVYELPLPGGPDAGDNPIVIKAEFDDVLDLVPQSSVKVNDVNVGRVTAVDLEGYTAVVTLEYRRDIELPDNAEASIRQTSLLGEKFVSLDAPETGASNELLDTGDVIPLSSTGRNVEVEEVLGALSLLLNGGGVAQLKTITQELNKALTGREDAVRSVLTQIEAFTGQLDDNKADVVAAITALDRLAKRTRGQQANINSALDNLPSALTSIDSQRADLISMLQALNRLGDVGVRVIRLSKESTIDSLRQLQPVLTELSNAGDAFVEAFHVFLTYPFVDEVVGRDPQVARNLAMGDFTNLSVTLDIDLTGEGGTLPGVPCIGVGQIPDAGPLPPVDELCDAAADAIAECLNDPSVANCQGLPDVVLDEVCGVVPLPGLCTTNTGNGGKGGKGKGPKLPEVEVPDLGLGGLGLGGLGGLLRPGTGYSPGLEAVRGPTFGQLSEAYDPALVALFVPPMMTTEGTSR